MEKNKYYTPDKEEFNVGFEYEVCFGIKSYNKQDLLNREFSPSLLKLESWERRIFSSADSVDINVCNDMFVKYDCNKQYFRVKYLDQKDIDELGLQYNVFITISNATDVEIYINQETIEHRHFSGTIKNKSELKRVLKMIGVIE